MFGFVLFVTYLSLKMIDDNDCTRKEIVLLKREWKRMINKQNNSINKCRTIKYKQKAYFHLSTYLYQRN